ncbi:MAG TPA: DUF2914 domain-containing protein [Candidatus Polarisedimenticolaceae bacterium]|nr:DUF2914 domain-containing protein [Candidatus Polarisedimenticolaceae bacterium]
MESTGGRLREERETRGMSLADLAEATGVGLPYLEAMEAGDFDALPGRAFGKLYIRAYAEVLTFDPQPLIEQYDRERRGEGHGGPDPTRPAPAGSRPVAEAIARWKAARSDVVAESLEPEFVEPEFVEPELVEPETVEPEAVADAEPAATQPEPEPVPVLEPLVPEPEPALAIGMIAPDPLAPPVANTDAPRSRRSLFIAGLVVAAIVIAILFAVSRRSTSTEPALPPVATAPVASPPPVSPPAPVVKEEAPAVAKSAPAPPPKVSPPKPSGPPSDLTISESGLGRRVVSGRLEGEGTEFHEGDVVCFQTRVFGGRRGDAIRHVWIYEGRAQQSIPLRVGDADWRTHSSKTIYKSGSWSVEARDAGGHVLASAAFTCRPRGQ